MNLMNFKIQGFFTTLIIGSVSALTISDAISQKVNAEAAPSCNNATITGSYGSTLTGTIAGSPIAGVGLVKLDGRGKLQSTAGASSVDGTVSTNNGTSSGTYSVKQDCTIQVFLGRDTYSGVIVDGGKEIFLLATVQGSVLTVTLKKVN